MSERFGWVPGEIRRMSQFLMMYESTELESTEDDPTALESLLQLFTSQRIPMLANVLKRDLDCRGGDNFCSQVLACCLYGGAPLVKVRSEMGQLPWTLLRCEKGRSNPTIFPVSEMAKESMLLVLAEDVKTTQTVVSSNIGFCVYAGL